MGIYEYYLVKYDAPPEETRYMIDLDRVNGDQYAEIARDATRAVLAVHPRKTVEIAVDAAPFVLRARNLEIEKAFERLLDAGLSVSELTVLGFTIGQKTGLGRVQATPAVLADVFTIFPLCFKLDFLDGNDELLVRYRERAYGCFFWLPSAKFSKVIERLDDETASVIVSFDDWIARQGAGSI